MFKWATISISCMYMDTVINYLHKFHMLVIKLFAMTSVEIITVLSTGEVQCSLRLRAIWVTD